MLSKKLKRKQGISLPIAMAITAVLIILSASLIAIAATSIMNTSSSVNQRQAYLNVRSALEYATAYYSDSAKVPKLEDISNEYMVMNDKEGGTTSEGAQLSTEAEANDYATYVVANYEAPSTSRDEPALVLQAFSKFSDAFGKKTQSVSLKKILTIRKSANKNRVTLTDIDMNTEVLNYNTIRDAITLHVKQYPGENWTPFYYLWTYRDEAEMYAQTGNCYGLESVYKDQTNNPGGIYYNSKGQQKGLLDGLNTNEHDEKNLLAPASVWNVIKDNSGDPRNGTTSYFTPTSNGWYDATYYIVNNCGTYSNGTPMKQVNYFNLIITAKGKVLNNTSTGQMDLNVQTNEMFHLWYLNNSDRNIYFEFLKPGMLYTTGSSWNGIQDLDDRMLVYVKNQKTTVHFKVKGIGDTQEEALNAELVPNPVINDIRISGVNIFQTDNTYESYGSAMSSVFYNPQTLENNWRNTRREDMKNFFFGIGTGQNKMMYEGCGWWVANISTGDNFSMTVTYYDKNKVSHTGSVNVSPNSENEAFVVVDLDRPAILSRLTESRANELIGVDDNSYTTIHVKTSEIGRGVAPYIDYRENDVSSTERRLLLEAVEKGQTYVEDDYEEAGFAKLTEAIDAGIALYNQVNYIREKGLTQANKDYKEATKKITDAIAALKTKVCSQEVYAEFEKLVERAMAIEADQTKNKSYDGVTYAAFISDTGIYKKCKALKESGEILDKTGDDAYTTTMVNQLIDELNDSINNLVRLDKSQLKQHVKDAKSLENNSRYEEIYRRELSDLIPVAEDIINDSTSQDEIEEMDALISEAIDAVKSHMAVQLNTAELTQLLTQANNLLDPTKEKVNCTDDSYNNLKAAVQGGQATFDKATAKQEEINAACDALKAAIEKFEVMKPSGATTDYLSSRNLIRVWVSGLNKGTTITGYYDDSNEYNLYDYEVVSFTLDEYIGTSPRGLNLNSDGANFIEGQNLTYFDIDASTANGFKPTLVVNHYVRSNVYNPATGSYPIVETITETFTTDNVISCADVRDNNFVISFESLKKTTSTSSGGKDQVINTLICSKGKLAEYFVKGYSSTSATIYTEGKKTIISSAVQEGSYHVIRFIYDANQKAVIKTFNPNTGEYIYGNEFETASGQYVIEFDDASKASTNILKVNIPYDVQGIAGDSLVDIYATVNGQNYSLAYDPVNRSFVYESGFTGSVSMTVTRVYYSGNRYQRTSKSSSVTFGSKGEYNCSYSGTNSMSASGADVNFVAESVNMTDVSRIYPRYNHSSGSGSSAAAELNGMVSDTLLSSVLSLPEFSSSVKTPFDYFVQAGEDSVPTKNLGTTVIWIDTNNSFFEGKDLSKLRVYSWDYNQQSLTGPWPGKQPIRVAESTYYYLPVNSNAQGCVLCMDYGGNNIQKIGCNDLLRNYNGNIYFDHTDYVIRSSYNSGRYMVISDVGICSIGGQGKASLFQMIDAEVLQGSYKYSLGGYRKNNADYYDGYVYRAPGKVTKSTYWYTDNNKTFPVQNANGDFERDWNGNLVYKPMVVYKSGTYYYRAKTSNAPPVYDYEEPYVDKSDMTGTNLRMAFVGGDKIRLKNQSYYYSYGTLYSQHHSSISSNKLSSNWSNNYKVNIAYNNLFGGNGGNGSSMGRVGDTEPSLIYDWYEYKIPVDKSNTFTFQVCGLKFNPSFGNVGSWFDNNYKTDTQYTEQINGVYGDVWLKLNNAYDVKDGKFTNMTIYTSSPEYMQINDNQDIYVRLPSGWSSSNLKVTASGVGEDHEYGFTNYNGMLKATIPSKTPFLVFEAKDASGKTFTCRTSLQGNDLILFDPTFRAGTGGWDSYIDPRIRVERELYAAHSIYYGSVIVKEYDQNGNPKNLGNQGSYLYAEGMMSHILSGHFNDQYVNDAGRSMDYSTVHSYVVAYTNLYATMAKARAYISGKNYPEFIHNGKPDIYDSSTIDELESELANAVRVYTSSGSDAGAINAANAALLAKINNVTVSTSDRIPLIFYDTQNLVGSGATFEVEYSTDAAGTNPIRKKIEYFNTEHCPIIFIGKDQIYNVKFIINGTEEGVVKDSISVIDGAWVYMDIAKKAGVTTSYWVQNTAADYRQIANTEFDGSNSGDQGIYDMTPERKSTTDVITPAATEDIAKSRSYRPITLYFKNDATVKLSGGSSYVIKAGAYSFTDKLIGQNGCPFVITRTSSGYYIPRLNLFSDKAKEYFEDPDSYWKYGEADQAVEAETLSNWVTKDGNNLDITAGGHTTTKTVNMTVNNRSFAANRTWSYLTSGKMYFRWEGNTDLKVNNTVKFAAEEIRFASSGTIDVSSNYDKHIYFTTKDNADSMEVIFPTDIHVEYIDRYRESHSFTIREGSYTVEKADPNQDFICDLCDEEYWESMVHVKINNRLDALGGYGGNSSGSSRFGSAIYSND